MKYCIEAEQGKSLTLSLTSAGRLREFWAGLFLGLTWGALGLTVFFLPDYIGKFSHDKNLEPWFWGTALTVLIIFSICFGLHRAYGTRRWVFKDGWLRQEAVGMLGRSGQGFEAPLSSIADVLVSPSRGRVVLQTASGEEIVLARAWFGRGQLEEVRKRILEVLGRD